MFGKRMGELESIKQSIIDSIRSNILDLLPVGTVLWFKQAPSDRDGLVLTNWRICEELIGRYPLGTSDVSEAGNIVEAGLPNIAGTISGEKTQGFWDIVSGAFCKGNTSGNYGSSESDRDNYNVIFDASKGTVSTITRDDAGNITAVEYLPQEASPYGKSTTVTPPSMKLLPYIKIA